MSSVQILALGVFIMALFVVPLFTLKRAYYDREKSPGNDSNTNPTPGGGRATA